MIEFFDDEGVVGTVEYVNGELVASRGSQNVATLWLYRGNDPTDFESAYDGWSNGYVVGRRVTDAVTAATFHLPGRHEQKKHGNRKNKTQSTTNDRDRDSDVDSTEIKRSSRSESNILDSDAIAELLDDPASFDYSSKRSEDRILAEIIRQREFDGKPQLVDSIDDAPGKLEMQRAVTDRRFAEQFLTGDYFAGKGQFGNGTYFLSSDNSDDVQARVGLYGDHRVRTKLRADARVVSFDELKPMVEERVKAAEEDERAILASMPDYAARGDFAGFQRDYERAKRKVELLRDPGRVAALLNYDAINVTPGQEFTEVVVLNRGALLAERNVL